jgi:filamentous hemagglutinin family protein
VAAVAVASCFAAGVALANPTGPVVVSGQASFHQQGSALSVTNSANAIIHWQSFSIGPAELTRFIQPSASSAVLNRVVGGIPSDILGALQSNGRVFLINPSGIVFGAGARIDVAGLVASTLDLANEDFLSGRLRFAATAGAGNIVNQGAIRTAPRGNVYLIAPSVENSGVITSPQGEIILAAGRSVELVDVGTPDLRVQITAPEGEALNLGSVVAQSGRIGIYAGLIQQKGAVNADTVVVGENGRISFKAKDITLAAGSVTTASGAPGGVHDGGEVRIVADGTLNMEAGAEVHVDGGVDGGHGGFLELSGKKALVLNRDYSVRARKSGFLGGTLLIDPTDIEICVSIECVVAGATQMDPANINVSGASTVTFAASNNIVVSSAISAADLRGGSPGAGVELTLAATNNAAINATIDFASDQRLFVEAGNSIVTGNNAVVRAGGIDFDATNGGITIGFGTIVLADNPGLAHVGLLAGTVTGSDFASAPANTVDILGSVAALGQGTNQVTIGGSRVTVADSGNVLAVTGGSPTASQALVAMAAMDTASGGFAQPGFVPPSTINYGVGNTVLVSGHVQASDPNVANVHISGGTVTISRGTGLTPGTPNIEVSGGFSGDVVVAALSQASNLDPGGIFYNDIVTGTDRTMTVNGWIFGQAGSTGDADVEVFGGTVTLGAEARLDAAGGFAFLEVAASSSTTEVVGATVVNTATFVPGNRVQVAAGATLNALGIQGAEVNIFGGSVNVAGSAEAQANGSAFVAAAAASLFTETFSEVGGQTEFTHAAGNDVTVSGVLEAGASGPGGFGEVVLVGDRVTVSGGSSASPNIVITDTTPFGGVLAVAASSSTFSGTGGAVLLASTHDATRNLVSVPGWITGAGDDVTLDLVGGSVNVSGGMSATGVTAAEITVAAVGSLTATLGSPITYRGTQSGANLASIGGTLTATGNSSSVISVLGGSVQVAGNLSAQGVNSRVALAAGGAATFTADPIVQLTQLTGPGTSTLDISGNVTAAQQVDILGGVVTVTGSGTVAVTGAAPGAINVAAVDFYTADLGGNVTTTHEPSSRVQVDGTLAADSLETGGRVSVLGGTVLVGGTVNADGAFDAGVEILAAGTASFAPGFVLTGFSATTLNTVGVSGSLSAGLGGPFTSGIRVQGGQVNFSGLAQSRSDNAGIFIAATSGFCSGVLCPSTPGMQATLSGTATATGLNTANVQVSAHAINQTGGTVSADGTAGAEVKLFTAGGDITVGGLVHADGGEFGEGIVQLQTGPTSGNITVTSTGSLQAADAFGTSGSGCPPVCASVTALAPAGTITINGSVLANNTGTGSGGAFIDLLGELGVTVNGSVSAQTTAFFAGLGLNAPGGPVLVGPGAIVLASNNGTALSGSASAALIGGAGGGINVQAGGSVAAVGQANSFVTLDTLGGITVGGSVSGTASGPSGLAVVFMGGSGGAAFINVQPGGEVEATAPAGGQLIGFASGDITIGGEIYGGVTGGGVILEAGGAIIGAGGTVDGGAGDAIRLTAANGIGAPGAPVRILDGEATVSAFNSTSGDLVLSQVNGDLFFGPAGNFTAVSNAGPGGIDLIAETGNADVRGLVGNGSFLRVAAAGGISSTGGIINTVGSVFLQAPGGVTLRDATHSAQEDFSINGGPVSIEAGDSVSAGRNLVISGTDITVRGASLLFAGSNMGLTALGNLTVEDSTVIGGNGNGLFTATVVGDFLIRGVNDISQVVFFPDIGSPTLPVTIFGALRMDGTTHPAVLESVSADSVYLFFPLLGNGGVFVNGLEQTSAGASGIFADGVPAVPGTNLFITYGAVGTAPDIIAPLTGYINQATELAVPAGEQGGQQTTGPGEEDDQKKKRPRNCS